MEEEKVLSNVSVDCVIFGYSNGELKVLLLKSFFKYQGKEYLESRLPGSHVRYSETVQNAADRLLREELGIDYLKPQQFNVFSDSDRLKNRRYDYEWFQEGLLDDRVITIGFFSLIRVEDMNRVDKDMIVWKNVYDVKDLLFDHHEIIISALVQLRKELLREPIGFALLPEKFSLSQLQRMYEVVFDTTYDKRNFRRRIAKMNYLIPLDEFQQGVSHKPARYYRFDQLIYSSTRKDCFDFRM